MFSFFLFFVCLSIVCLWSVYVCVDFFLLTDLLVFADARVAHSSSSSSRQFPPVCQVLKPGEGFLSERLQINTRRNTAALLRSLAFSSSTASSSSPCVEEGVSFSSSTGGKKTATDAKDNRKTQSRSLGEAGEEEVRDAKREKEKKKENDVNDGFLGEEESGLQESLERSKRLQKSKEVSAHAIPVIPAPASSKSEEKREEEDKTDRESLRGSSSLEKKSREGERKTISSFFHRKRRERLARKASRRWSVNPNRCFVILTYPNATFTADDRWERGEAEEERGGTTEIEEEEEERRGNAASRSRSYYRHLGRAGSEVQAIESLSEPIVASILASYDRILRLPLGYIITPSLLSSSSFFSREDGRSLHMSERKRELFLREKECGRKKSREQHEKSEGGGEEEGEGREREETSASPDDFWLLANPSVDGGACRGASNTSTRILQEYGRYGHRQKDAILPVLPPLLLVFPSGTSLLFLRQFKLHSHAREAPSACLSFLSSRLYPTDCASLYGFLWISIDSRPR